MKRFLTKYKFWQKKINRRSTKRSNLEGHEKIFCEKQFRVEI